MKRSKLIEIIREEIRSALHEAEGHTLGEPYRNMYASGVIPRLEDDEEEVEEGAESGYRKLKAKPLPKGYDKGEDKFGSPKDYANFGGSGFKKGKAWSYGPRGKETGHTS